MSARETEPTQARSPRPRPLSCVGHTQRAPQEHTLPRREGQGLAGGRPLGLRGAALDRGASGQLALDPRWGMAAPPGLASYFQTQAVEKLGHLGPRLWTAPQAGKLLGSWRQAFRPRPSSALRALVSCLANMWATGAWPSQLRLLVRGPHCQPCSISRQWASSGQQCEHPHPRQLSLSPLEGGPSGPSVQLGLPGPSGGGGWPQLEWRGPAGVGSLPPHPCNLQLVDLVEVMPRGLVWEEGGRF